MTNTAYVTFFIREGSDLENLSPNSLKYDKGKKKGKTTFVNVILILNCPNTASPVILDIKNYIVHLTSSNYAL